MRKLGFIAGLIVAIVVAILLALLVYHLTNPPKPAHSKTASMVHAGTSPRLVVVRYGL